MLRFVQLLLVSLLLGVSAASAQPQPDPLPRLLLMTANEWAWGGEVYYTCVPQLETCQGTSELPEEYPQPHYPLPIAGPFTWMLADIGLWTNLTLSVLELQQDQYIIIDTIVFDAPFPEDNRLTWEPNLEPGQYLISASLLYAVENEPIQRIEIAYPVQLLSKIEAAEHETAPPPLLLETANDGPVSGLQGGYCFPPGEGGTCVAFEAPPTPDTFYRLPARDRITLHLPPLPHPQALHLSLMPTADQTVPQSVEHSFEEDTFPALNWSPELPDLQTGDYVLRVRLQWDATSDAEYYFGVTVTDPAAPSDSTGVQPPQFSLWTAENNIVGGAQGSYCWGSDGVALCADYMLTLPETYHPIVEGNLIYIVIQSNDFPDSVFANLLTPELDEVLATAMNAPEPGVFALLLDLQDVPPGDYVLIVSGYWNEGKDTSNIFGIRVFEAQ